MFVCAFWAIVFGIDYRNLTLNKRILCGFMVVATSLYFGHFVVFNHLYHWVPVTDTIYSLATLSVYPIFLLYIISLTGKLRRRDILILMPGILFAVVIGVCYALLPTEKLYEFVVDCHYEEKMEAVDLISHISLVVHRLMKPVIALQVVLVLYFGFRKLTDFKRKVEDFYSNTAHKDLSEIRHLLVFFVITSCLSVVADLTGRAFFVDSTLLMTLVLAPFSIMLFAIGYVGYHQGFTIDDLMVEMKDIEVGEEQETKEAKAQNLEIRKKLLVEIRHLMEEEHLFLQNDLKLSDIAEHLHTNRTYVYEALKLMEEEGVTSFNDYVNRYRIEYSLQLFKENPEESIEQIAYACGFSSKTTFYVNFKKVTGMTPKQYLKNEG